MHNSRVNWVAQCDFSCLLISFLFTKKGSGNKIRQKHEWKLIKNLCSNIEEVPVCCSKVFMFTKYWKLMHVNYIEAPKVSHVVPCTLSLGNQFENIFCQHDDNSNRSFYWKTVSVRREMWARENIAGDFSSRKTSELVVSAARVTHEAIIIEKSWDIVMDRDSFFNFKSVINSALTWALGKIIFVDESIETIDESWWKFSSELFTERSFTERESKAYCGCTSI